MGNDRDAPPALEVARKLKGRGPDVDNDRLTIVDQSRRCGADCLFGRLFHKLASGERRLVRATDDTNCASANPAQLTLIFEDFEVAPNRHLGNLEIGSERGDRHFS